MINNVTLQINLAPGDYLHARHILKHQLSILAAQVNEIILTVDTRPAKGRFATGWQEYKKAFDNFLIAEIQPNYNVKIVPVDYSDETKSKVARYFFGGKHIPEKDFRGGPFYVYFFGLYTATNNLVFHLDSDILLGGGSKNWINEAKEFYNNDENCFIVSPLPGPPHDDDILIDQSVISKLAPYTYQLNGMSTRLFMIDKSKFDLHKLRLTKPTLRSQVKAVAEGNPNAELPEILISAFMAKYHLKRIDFLGSGLWSLHPPYRTTNFYDALPALIGRINNNQLPKSQQGFYDIVDDVCNWDEAREKLKNNRWWNRLLGI
ncbi:hypothetical protein FFF34_000245 [Inquilinus sp. KBS0705]|nr:hypothetical protein FFF34_000245 [Inquilinus sp. KBS0705]